MFEFLRYWWNHIIILLFGPKGIFKLYVGYESSIIATKFSSDNKLFFVRTHNCAAGKEFYLFESASRKKVKIVPKDYCFRCKFTPDAKYLIMQHLQKIGIYSLIDNSKWFLDLNSELPFDLDISADSRWLLLTFWNNNFRLFDLQKQKFIDEFVINNCAEISQVLWISASKFLIFAQDNKILKMEIENLNVKILSVSKKLKNRINFVLNSHKTKLLAYRVTGGGLYLADIPDNLKDLKFSCFKNTKDVYHRNYQFINDQLIISVCSNHNIMIWDAEKLQLLKVFKNLFSIDNLSVSPDAKTILLGGRDTGGYLYQIPALPYQEFLGFNFNGSNFHIMSKWFQQATLTFLLCCQRHRKGKGGVLTNLPRDMRQLILVYVSYRPWNFKIEL